MEYTTTGDNEYEYHKDVQVEEGKEYQYKFRIGEGDWWILNEDAPTGTYSRAEQSTSNLVSITARWGRIVLR
jgi:hypothetical protein